MTTTIHDLIEAAKAAADLFRDGDTPDQHEIRNLVRAVDAHQDRTAHEDGCLMCAVRALTEGDPAASWVPGAGATISGVVLRKGELTTEFGQVPFVDLWTGGTGRVRVAAYPSTLRRSIEAAAPRIGDRLQVWFDGERFIEPPHPKAGRTYKAFSVNVQRGH